jgi:hypothetical protein
MHFTVFDGPPRLHPFEAPDRLRCDAHFRLETLWINEGGAGTGLVVTFWGPALEQKFLALTGIVVGDIELPIRNVQSGGIVRLELPDWQIQPGVDARSGAVSPELIAAYGRSQIAVIAIGEVLRGGSTALWSSATPLQDTHGEAFEVQVALRRERRAPT